MASTDLQAVPDPADDGSAAREDQAGTEPVVAPGAYALTAAEYHADPVPGGSLSSTGARKLLDTCPDVFRWWQTHPEPPTATFDEGHAAHGMVLGAGPTIVPIEPHTTSTGRVVEDWSTYAVKDEVRAIRAAGMVPVKRSTYDRVTAMAGKLAAHPLAPLLLTEGAPEVSLFSEDRATGVMMRARLDWLPYVVDRRRRLIIADYKSARSARPADIRRAVWEYGYHVQLWWYGEIAYALGLTGDRPPAMVLIVQEKAPPYAVGVYEPDEPTMRWAGRQARTALATYARCVAKDRWPGYGDDQVLPTSLPAYAERELNEAAERGELDVGQ